MPRVVHPLHRLLPFALLAASACTDSVVGPVNRPPPGGGIPGTPVTLEQVVCNGNLQERRLTCGRPAGTGAAQDILYGGQNVYITVTSSNVAYNSGTGQFTFDVTLTNLIEQPIGTTDGTTLDPNGVRVFFSTGPTVTGGSGAASVLPDGFATFTALSQPYYQFNNMLANGATSPTKTWTLIMPPTVTTFTFVVFVSSPVEYPNGYITLDGQLPDYSFGSLHPGDTHGLTAVVKSAVGNVVGGAVTFGTSNAGCATVNGTGTVTGVQYATCNITATAGAITGSMSFDVTGSNRVWNGSVSSDWSLGTNWNGGLAPATVDSATIPSAVPNYPALVANTGIGGVDVADNATLSLGVFDLTASANVATGPTAGSGILGTTGRLILTGTNETVHGRLPNVLVSGTYSLSESVYAVAATQVDSGELTNVSYNLEIVSQ